MSDRHPLGLPEDLASLDRPLVMGILNVTPDSFSDGGRYADAGSAIEHGLLLRSEGADIVDVGGESTRPGSVSVDADEECRRVIPVVAALAAQGVRVSIDTMHAPVAEAAVDAGAVVINDVSGGLVDRRMLSVARDARVPYIAMHWRGAQDRNHAVDTHGDPVSDVISDLRARLDAAEAAGMDRRQVVIDPGLGFAKSADDNWALLRHLRDLRELGAPVLIGASRKRFLGDLLADETGPRDMADRDAATAAVSALATTKGAWGVRVHEPRATLDAVMVAMRLGGQV